MAIFPPPASVNGKMDGVFTEIHSPFDPAAASPIQVTAELETPAGPAATSLNGTDEKTWDNAAVYKFDIPLSAQGRKTLLDIHFIGDAARLYVGDKFFDDNFYNGDPFSIALWRIPTTDWPNIKLKVLPYSYGLFGRLPQQARDLVNQAKKISTLDQVTVVTQVQLEVKINPK
jgi:hypothetical protein